MFQKIRKHLGHILLYLTPQASDDDGILQPFMTDDPRITMPNVIPQRANSDSASGPTYDPPPTFSASFNNVPPPPNLTPHVVRIDDRVWVGGNFGDVYRCWYRVCGSAPQEVAVKALRFESTIEGDAKEKSTLRRELGIWRRLRHNNIVPFLGVAYGFGMRGSLSLVSSWMPNATLHKFLKKYDDKLDVVHRLHILLDIANGLNYLHSFSIVHGDLNTNNVLLDADYTARLADFGRASLVGNIPEASEYQYLQASTAKWGAMRFIAPEQIDSQWTPNRTTKSDIYSFGCIALEVFSGQQPWSEVPNVTSIIVRLHQGHNPGRPRSPAIDDSHWNFVQLCWLSPQERPVPDTIIHSLQQFLSDQPQSLPLRHLLPLPDDAFDSYKRLMACSPAVLLDLWEAARAWVQDAEKHEHSSVLEAYRSALDALDHITSFSSSLDSRHETMQAIVADLPSDAFSCATRHGNFQMAVELLDRGRAIIWNQLARCDISIATLESWGDDERKLGNRFKRLSAALRRHAEGSEDEDTDSYSWTQKEWESVVDKIRLLDGFSRFLLPARFEDLQQAAKYGPVIIVNASKYSCDALIVLSARQPVHVPLPCSLDDVILICSELLELTRDPHAYDDNREFYVKKMLRDLWSFAVKPIVDVLQNDIQLPEGSRIWWCPTSKFTILPFHAAGPHHKTQKNLMDIYVSSYAPSLSALIRARDRVRSQQKARNASGIANVVSFAAVGQAHPSADLMLPALLNIELEINKIHHEASMAPGVKFETVAGDAATIEGAVQAFRDHRWAHVACHGAQHAERPFESWFAMKDGKLTLMRTIRERYTNSEFAFLSACHTAVGDRSTPDEVLHLAAGMQFAGFNGVVGTLWMVDDAAAHQLVARFYKEMFKHPVVDFEHAAAALNVAVVESAEEVSLEKRIVFVHIGI